MLEVSVREIQSEGLSLYDAIPSRLVVRTRFRVEPIDGGLGGLRLVEEDVPVPYVKDYDSAGCRPHDWPIQFAGARWCFLLATRDEVVVGGAAIAMGASLLPMGIFQRADLAVLWDLRVMPAEQGRGVGTLLFHRAAAWARGSGSRQLGLETQNVNVPACRFYARRDCRLGAIHAYGYAGSPNVAEEAMLLWYREL
jgi:GNAT superfamily N-acetyltransferase